MWPAPPAITNGSAADTDVLADLRPHKEECLQAHKLAGTDAVSVPTAIQCCVRGYGHLLEGLALQVAALDLAVEVGNICAVVLAPVHVQRRLHVSQVTFVQVST